MSRVMGEPMGHAGLGGLEDAPLCPARRLTRADFDAMAAMEARFYGEDLITPAEETWHWYERHPFTTVAARARGGEVAGFVNLFPVTAPVHDALLAGSFNDASLTADDVVDPWDRAGEAGCEAPFHMFLSCVVVDVPWQGTGLAYRLLDCAASQYAEHARRIADVAVDTATPDGAKLARNLGFAFVRPSDHGTQIWQSGWDDFVSKLTS